MKDLFYYNECPNCKNLNAIKLSNFIENQNQLKCSSVITIDRKCPNCGTILKYTFKYTCFAKEIKNAKLEEIYSDYSERKTDQRREVLNG